MVSILKTYQSYKILNNRDVLIKADNYEEFIDLLNFPKTKF